ncbi:YIP1 family protein [Deinococcus irradiatisoli]|uniref:YIP1 family protein n=1 Tax=Deinococcus irradiatisoli TaxID=2202254 RepID=A0A2Z3JBD5_9DEIO|nr:YIP1 family protein [Deinococcus irradiatisoli]AWN22342.1 YIP1 family protein [Deinococcus irradiatisoli]
MQKSPQLSPSIQTMFAQSTAVLSQPSVATFEKFEWRGGVQSAYTYVLVAAVVSAIIAAIFAPFHREVTFFGQLLSRLITIPVSFAVFTGAVYYIGKALFKGTGTYAEVAYTFALFYVPLSILGTVIGIIPILGWLVGFVISLAMIYFGFLAVQSSMNVRTNGEGIALLVLSGLAYFIVSLVLAGVFASLFFVR